MAEGESQGQAAEGSKKGRLKVPLVVGALMLLEGAAVVGFLMLMGPKPQTASAELEGVEQAGLEQTVELPLVQGRFQNMSTNQLWQWDAEIFIKVKRRHEAFVADLMERRKAELMAGETQIFRRAQHNHLKEPELRTLTRQLTALAEDVFGVDAEGEPRVEEVIIASLNGRQIGG